jgi:hypothetical protein
MSEDVTITEAIEQLCSQLEDALKRRKGSKLHFRATSLEVEFAVVLKAKTKGPRGVRAWVLDNSGRTKTAATTTHKVKLVLTSVSPSDELSELTAWKGAPAGSAAAVEIVTAPDYEPPATPIGRS